MVGGKVVRNLILDLYVFWVDFAHRTRFSRKP
jgi:hypothetical protein